MSEHDDEIRAKCQWLVDNKHITSPVETGMLICEVFDAFKEIATLKAQLKREMAAVDFLTERGNRQDKTNNAYCVLQLFNDALFIARETVKARGVVSAVMR